MLVEYGQLQVDQYRRPKISIFNIEKQLKEPCIAAPYNPTDTCINAIEWMFLKPWSKWYNILCDHLEAHLIKNKQLDPLPRNR